MIYVSYYNPGGVVAKPVIVKTVRDGFTNEQYLPPDCTVCHQNEPGDIVTIEEVESERSARSLSESKGE